MTLWTLLALFIFGCALFEFGSRNITLLEANNDYNSTRYYTFLNIVGAGLFIGLSALLEIFWYVEKILGIAPQSLCRRLTKFVTPSLYKCDKESDKCKTEKEVD